MPSTRVFRSLGLFVAEDFLAEAECLEYRTAIAGSVFEPGAIRTRGTVEEVDVGRRAVQIAAVPRTIRSRMKARSCEIGCRLETHFGVALQDCEHPQFLDVRARGLSCSPHRRHG